MREKDGESAPGEMRDWLARSFPEANAFFNTH